LGTDRETGRSRGFAFVEFSSEDEASAAIKQFDGFEVDGRKLRVNTAEDRPRTPGGPRFGAPRGDRPSYGAPSSPAPWAGFASGAGGGATDAFGGGRPFKNKGSRRGLRGKKRSLNF
jgi:heterogeneous nuclear ribonucleoprotein A1/A3